MGSRAGADPEDSHRLRGRIRGARHRGRSPSTRAAGGFSKKPQGLLQQVQVLFGHDQGRVHHAPAGPASRDRQGEDPPDVPGKRRDRARRHRRQEHNVDDGEGRGRVGDREYPVRSDPGPPAVGRDRTTYFLSEKERSKPTSQVRWSVSPLLFSGKRKFAEIRFVPNTLYFTP